MEIQPQTRTLHDTNIYIFLSPSTRSLLLSFHAMLDSRKGKRHPPPLHLDLLVAIVHTASFIRFRQVRKYMQYIYYHLSSVTFAKKNLKS